MGKRGGKKSFYKNGAKNTKFNRNSQKNFSSDHNLIKREYIAKDNLREKDVGILEYVSKLAGFTAVFKSRFSDFHVNEIDCDGKEVKLTDLTVPKPPKEILENEQITLNKNKVSTILTTNVQDEIKIFVNDSKKESGTSFDIDVTDVDKDTRTLVHKALKEQYGSSICTTTITANEKKFIKCLKSKGKGDNQRSQWNWPEEYVYFVLHKENADTVQAASDLAFHLKLQPSRVNYAGTKDKRGKTTQTFCVKKREPSQIMRASARFPYMKIGNFQFKKEVLKLGQLKGNRFKIVLRHVNGEDDLIKGSLENIKTEGFINYYGLQRFGNSASVPTFDVGIALLKEDYKEACELILKPRVGDIPFLHAAREYWWKNRNSAQASAMIHNNKFLEKKLLDGLAMYGEKDYANALRRIPRNMLLLYTHAFQSLVWNQIASRRAKEFGLNPICGDLVYHESADENEDIFEEVLFEDTEDCPDNEDETKNTDESQTESIHKRKVKTLTEEDISSGKYNIFDIVLPLPGYDITYPGNIKSWYDEILAERGLTSERLKHKVKTYSLAGAYRKLIIKPRNMQWEFKGYNTPTSTLVSSDYEDLKGIKAESNNPEGNYKSLIIDFELPASTYATMALREILKLDTSAAFQSQINNEENKKHPEVLSDIPKTEIAVASDQEIADVPNEGGINQNLEQKRKQCEDEIVSEKRQKT